MTKIYVVLSCVFFTVSHGLEFVPNRGGDYGTLIWYKAGNRTNTKYWIDQINDFLKPYVAPRIHGERYVDCNEGEPPEPGSQKICDFKLHNFGHCTAADDYNYNSPNGGPCIFLKFDKDEIRGWEPGYYDLSNMPKQMPTHLKEYIKYKSGLGRSNKAVWVSCEGETPTDVENIGPLMYYPLWGFDSKYFPVSDVDGYLSPIVVVNFEQPTRGLVIMVTCTAWAKELNGGELSDQGSVHFELMVD